jgi:hypothetical protein
MAGCSTICRISISAAPKHCKANTRQSSTAYQDFFAAWKDITPDILILLLKAATAEYKQLKLPAFLERRSAEL